MKKIMMIVWIILAVGILIWRFDSISSMFVQTSTAEGEFIKTEGKILSIQESKTTIKRAKRFFNKKAVATVSFKTENGKEFKSPVIISHFKFLRGFTDVGDKMTIYYKKKNPSVARSSFGQLEQSSTGFMLLGGIAFVIIASLFGVFRMLTIKHKY